jgi:tetratricopeptide (TPR) repeat protein
MQRVVWLKPAWIVICLAALAANAQEEPNKAAKRSPQAKTRQEYKDYNGAYVIVGGLSMEKAADEFAVQYPNSELRVYLYSKAMHEYQNANNPAKMLAMGERVLALDPDNCIALVLTATVLSDSLSDTDSDRTEKIAKIKKDANLALQIIDPSFVPSPGATPEQIAEYKATLVSMAYAALGIMELKTAEDAAAEKDLKAAAEANKKQPDCYVWYHLGLAQDHLKKYAEALSSVDQALKYAGSNPDLAKLAQDERTRLGQLALTTHP